MIPRIVPYAYLLQKSPGGFGGFGIRRNHFSSQIQGFLGKLAVTEFIELGKVNPGQDVKGLVELLHRHQGLDIGQARIVDKKEFLRNFKKQHDLVHDRSETGKESRVVLLVGQKIEGLHGIFGPGEFKTRDVLLLQPTKFQLQLPCPFELGVDDPLGTIDTKQAHVPGLGSVIDLDGQSSLMNPEKIRCLALTMGGGRKNKKECQKVLGHLRNFLCQATYCLFKLPIWST